MSKTVDLNEIASEQEKQNFKLICKVFEAMCIALLCVFSALSVILLGVIIFIGAAMNDIIVIAVNTVLLILGMASALNFGRVIFRKLKSGESPFRYDIADKVKGAAFALGGSGFLGFIAQSVSHIFSEKFSDICHYYAFIAVGSCIVGLLLGIMAYVMNYGCKLQQEADEIL